MNCSPERTSRIPLGIDALIILAAGLLALGTAGCATAPETSPAKPNVIFIAVDDLNDWVGYLGGHPQAQTPHIDALAEESFTFEHAYCPAPVCGPSRTALMYGIAPHQSGSYGHADIYNARKILPEERLPLNLVFQENGYYTAGCGKIFHYREERGWDDFRHHIEGTVPAEITLRVGSLACGIHDTDNNSETSDGKLTDWAIDQLEQPQDKPFFIALGLKKPHLPWVAPKKYFDQFPLETVQLPEVPQDDLDDLSEAGQRFAKNMVGFHKVNDHEAVFSAPAMPLLVLPPLAAFAGQLPHLILHDELHQLKAGLAHQRADAVL